MLRVGTDLTSVPEVRDAIATHGRRYLDRIFTPEELADAQGDPARLAARFAAKEAVVKVLRPDDDAIPWNHIRVRRHPGGWTDLVLGGRAAERARAAGLAEWAVSLSHQDDLATAVVVATSRPPIYDRPHAMTQDDVRTILADHARLPVDPAGLEMAADLYEAGMTSHASVNVMLALEDHFDVEFPDEMLKPSVFASIDAIVRAVEQLRADQAAA